MHTKTFLGETEIYLMLKKWLQRQDWLILGGEPPGGTNSIPVIEIKEEKHTEKGSKGSKKIDLICYKNGYFLLIEIKKKYSYSDIKKLNGIVSDEKWRRAFIKALREKQTLAIKKALSCIDESTYTERGDFYIKAVSFNDLKINPCPPDFVIFTPIQTGEIKVTFNPGMSASQQKLFIS